MKNNTQIFINLAVKDLNKAKAFFSSLGFSFNQQFTNEQAACMVISEDHSYVMLLVEDFFKTFIKKTLADANKSTEVLICLSCDSRSEVDEMVAKAIAAGGRAYKEAKDHGFMYEHGFEDLDGHLWEVMHMDMSAVPAQL
jgi:uncharacterized protein